MTRAAIEVEDLLKLVLVLVVLWLAIQIVGGILGILRDLLSFVGPLLGLLIVGLIVLYLLDRL